MPEKKPLWRENMVNPVDIDSYRSEYMKNLLTLLLHGLKDGESDAPKRPDSHESRGSKKKGNRRDLSLILRDDGQEGDNHDEKPYHGQAEEKSDAPRGLYLIDGSKPHEDSITIEDILKYYRHKSIVGEEKNCVLQTLCAANGISFGIEGNSGSGKTFLVDALMDLLPESDVYELGLASEQAAFNDAKKINKCRYIYIPEIQKAMNKSRNKASSVIELIKNLTEGKDASRIVTVKRGEVQEYRIKAGVTIIYTLALENSFKKDSETSRRFIRFMTDISPEHIDEVLLYKAQERCSTNGDGCISSGRIDEIKKHIKGCIEMPELSYFDPFSIALNEYIPATPKSVGFVNHYYNLLNASAKFNHKSRFFVEGALVIDLEDHYNVHSLYYDEFCKTLKQLNTESGTETDTEMGQIDWKRLWGSGRRIMEEQFPKIAEKWADKQVKDGMITVYDVPSKQYTHVLVDGDVSVGG